jgi:hypothetical protein
VIWTIVEKYFVGLEHGCCKDFVECLMKDGKPKVASKYTYLYLQENHKWGKRDCITRWNRLTLCMYGFKQNHFEISGKVVSR